MEVILDSFSPDASFWEEYTVLWKNSQYQSSFQAPLFLNFLASIQKTSPLILRGYRDKKLIAATFFYKKGRELVFLSDIKTDHNYFLLHSNMTDGETKQYFRSFLKQVEKGRWTLRLNKQPSWVSYMDHLREACFESKLFWRVVPYNPCLVLEAENPEALFEATNKQKLRQKLNRLKDKDEVTFEVLQGEEDLDHWLQEFYDAHIKRWSVTPTPSSFVDPSKRSFYKFCVLAWIKQGILVRFAIKLGTTRIAFVVALLENGYLVHHSTSYLHDYEKQSPGLIIINLIARWMADRQMTKMEFGDGGEHYKYQFTKMELPLQTIFATHSLNIPYKLKVKMIQFNRENKKMRDFYNARIRPLLLRSKILKKKIT
jgi:hypothetical protein